MIVNIEGKDHYVYWKHGHSEMTDIVPIKRMNRSVQFIEKNRRNTVCKIVCDGEVVTEGEAICHPNDNFSKAHGRKKSLQKALAPLARDVRTKFWKTFI